MANEKNVLFIKINGIRTEVLSCDRKKFDHICEYEGLLSWGAVHKTGKDFKICEVKTSGGPMLLIVCKNCFEKAKEKEWFIREVKYEVCGLMTKAEMFLEHNKETDNDSAKTI